MDKAAGIVVLFLVLGLVLVFTISRFSKAQSILEDWARQYGYTLLECQRKDFFRGPFFLTTSKAQVVFQITVADVAGRRRTGYAKVGGFMTGLLSDQVTVRWDDEA
jgi:hypothetical protein